jgi:hypothetical protein
MLLQINLQQTSFYHQHKLLIPMGAKKNIHTIDKENIPDIYLLGISSHENDYRISWAMNSLLGLKLTKSENHKSLNKRLGELQEFSVYKSESDEFSPIFKLISNRCDNGFLLEDLKNIDFLFLVEHLDNSINTNDLSQQIKSIPFISAVFPLQYASLKHSNRLA